MAKYFIDREIYWQGKRQPPRKIILKEIIPRLNGHSAICYDEYDNDYDIELTEIFDDNDNPIKDVRTRLGLSQVKFAKLFDIPRTTLEKWESGESHPPKYVQSMLLEKAFSLIDMKEGAEKHEKIN